MSVYTTARDMQRRARAEPEKESDTNRPVVQAANITAD
jgi:hypothetical protein